LRNNKGVIIATGQSPPIMVTDDHKGSKELPPSISDTRKITRAASADSDKEESSNALATPASSRKNSACEIDLINNNVSQSCLPDSNTSSLVFGHPGEAIPSPSNTITTDYITQSPSTPTLAGIWQDMTMNPTSYGPFQLPITDKLNLHHCSTNTNLTNSPLPPINQFSSPIRQKFRRIVAPTDTCLINPLQEQHCHPDSTSRYMISSPPIIITSAQAAMVPVLDHIEPPLGPTTGGTEIAIFGQNFDTGLIVMFGDCAATTLSCSSNTIICLLPIADKPGPVVLSFKEHSFLRTCPEPPLFSYYETSHQDMIDLALEASGNNFISAVEKQQLQECAFSQRNIEMQVIHMLSQQQQYMDETKSNIGGQNLLHLAAHLNYGGLAHLLLTHNSALVHTLDRNGLTPLHFACKSKSTFVIEILLKVGAHVGAMSSFGTPLQIVSFMLDDSEYAALQREISSGQPKVNPVSWLPNIFGT
jgi:hypothetical protein